MTQVSKLLLSKVLEQEMHSLLRKVLADLRQDAHVGAFLDDLLSKTEKIMLGKRLAIAVLLSKGYEYRSIHRILKVGMGTIASVQYQIKNGNQGYSLVIDKLNKEEKLKSVLNSIDDTLRKIFTLHKPPPIPADNKPIDSIR